MSKDHLRARVSGHLCMHRWPLSPWEARGPVQAQANFPEDLVWGASYPAPRLWLSDAILEVPVAPWDTDEMQGCIQMSRDASGSHSTQVYGVGAGKGCLLGIRTGEAKPSLLTRSLPLVLHPKEMRSQKSREDCMGGRGLKKKFKKKEKEKQRVFSLTGSSRPHTAGKSA